LWARFGEGALAHEHLVHLVTDFATLSLLDLHPPEIFQIEGNLGGTAAVAEMLLQSQGGLLRLLPALPPAWPEGRVRGLRARGGFEVSVAWTAGQPTQIDILSQRDGPCRLLLPPAWPPLQVQSQGPAVPATTEAGVLRFDTRAGQRYELSPER
jgi:alpha-L-fucosidase 2